MIALTVFAEIGVLARHLGLLLLLLLPGPINKTAMIVKGAEEEER